MPWLLLIWYLILALDNESMYIVIFFYSVHCMLCTWKEVPIPNLDLTAHAEIWDRELCFNNSCNTSLPSLWFSQTRHNSCDLIWKERPALHWVMRSERGIKYSWINLHNRIRLVTKLCLLKERPESLHSPTREHCRYKNRISSSGGNLDNILSAMITCLYL